MADQLRTFRDAIAIVTGGASGIGRAMSQELGRRGANVVLADLQLDVAEQVAEGIRAAGGKASAAKLDTTDYEAYEALVHGVAGEHGRLDYLFNNAGIGVGGELQRHGADDWRACLSVNVDGVVNGIRVAYPLMLEQGFGHLVNTSSMAALIPSPMSAVYAGTKSAVLSFSLAARVEGRDAGVRVSALCPGVIDTPILDRGGKYGRFVQNVPAEELRAYWEQFKPMRPDAFARKAIGAVAKNKPIIIYPFRWKIVWWINRLSPRLGLWLMNKPCRQARALLRAHDVES